MAFLGYLGVFLSSVFLLLWSVQYAGIYDVKGAVQPLLARLPFVGYTVAEERLTPAELQKRELERIQEAIAEKEQVLANKELELSEREKSLMHESEMLEQRRRQIREIENKLAEQARLEESRDRRLNRLVEIYTAMPPYAAAKQLEGQEDGLVVDLLQRMRADIVAIILAQMPRERATALTLKMGRPETVTQ